MNDIPSLCECGCGEVAPLAPKTVTARGIIKGQPLRFMHGHNRRKSGAEYLVDPETGCWIWQRAIAYSRGGYGVAYDGRKPRDAHRVFYERVHGRIPTGQHLHLHHKCGNPPCVNPDHLELLAATTHGVETRRHRQRLVMDEVREIRAAPTGYGTGRALAEKYGVDEQCISLIRRNKIYREEVHSL